VNASEFAERPPLPDHEGFAGAFAGVANGSLYESGDVGCCETLPFARFPLEWVTENNR
jgi:hypothetical protein